METVSLGITILIVLSILISAGGVIVTLIAYVLGKMAGERLRVNQRHRA